MERAWEFIKGTNDQAQLEAFIREFADTPYAEVARARLEELKKLAAAVPAPRPDPQSEGTRSPSPEGRGWLGVKLQNIDASIATRLGFAAPRGVLVTEITTPSPAAESDLRVDAIISVNGRAIADDRDLAQQIASLSSDTKVRLSILRSGNEIAVFVRLGEIPSGALAKTERLSGGTRFNGEWRVVFTFNEQCATAFRRHEGHWTIAMA